MKSEYGQGTATFDEVGGILGIRQLVSDFYELMTVSEKSFSLKKMHPQNLEVSKDKLSCLLSGWMSRQS